MKTHTFILKILLPAVICFILIRIVNIPFSFYPLSFGLVIGITNRNIHRYKPYLGVLLNILISYVAFFIAYLSMPLIGYLIEELSNNIFKSKTIGIITFSISPYIIAPLLVFFLYKLVFNIPKTRLSIIIVIVSIIILIAQNYFFYSQELNQKSINSFTGWQVIMALALQLILYQKELKAIFMVRNGS